MQGTARTRPDGAYAAALAIGRPEAADRDRIATHAGELRALISQLK